MLLWVRLLAWLRLPWMPPRLHGETGLSAGPGEDLGLPPRHCPELSLASSPRSFPSGHSAEGPTAPFSLLHPLPFAGPPLAPHLCPTMASLDPTSLPETTSWHESRLASGLESRPDPEARRGRRVGRGDPRQPLVRGI
ncbi:unnamed protein product [Rangifer tarandus platyrhynchus]|uniref:Uncharacterized protein n=2 Tax=Rangifer tarandus platyrhynchus TaxID=3082113 RepID=A0ABN8Z658_RANTA|nr:unnamed protein product [Rangifer tarandus platyrhynchus]